MNTPSVPVLTFGPEPDGRPPAVLLGPEQGNLAFRPAGGPPMLIVRKRTDVLRVLTDTVHFGMAGITDGDLTRCPLTGAEMQSPHGGLLNIDPPRLRTYRQPIARLFTPRAAEKNRPEIRRIAHQLANGRTKSKVQTSFEVISGFAEPFSAQVICRLMDVPGEDWPLLLESSRIAFGVVPSAEAIKAVEAAWQILYGYYYQAVHQRGSGIINGVRDALHAFTPAEIVAVIATISNGFGAILPVVATGLTELLYHPKESSKSWATVVSELLGRRTIFPVALPRVVLADTRMGGYDLCRGQVILASIVGAAHDGPISRDIAFGAGPHFCPGAALTRVCLEEALRAFFARWAGARIINELEWQPGTLSMPKEVYIEIP